MKTIVHWGALFVLGMAGCSGSPSGVMGPEDTEPSMDPGKKVGPCQPPRVQPGEHVRVIRQSFDWGVVPAGYSSRSEMLIASCGVSS
jgi:hypothetical protein